MRTITNEEMKHISGGYVDPAYCEALNNAFEAQKLEQTWTDEQWIATTDAWNLYCRDYNVREDIFID